MKARNKVYYTNIKLTLVLLRSAFNSAISSSRSSSVSLACVSSFVSVANSCKADKIEEWSVTITQASYHDAKKP